MIYKFLDFQVNPQTRDVYYKGETINLSKKSFDILVLLLKKKGSILTKEEILESVWPGQIVTDAALNKQITRLRKDLNDTNKDIIETVRGVGIKLSQIAELTCQNRQKISNTSKKTYLIFSVVFAFVILFVAVVFYKKEHKNILPDNNYNITIVPANNDKDWFSIGGLDYLASQLQQLPGIETVSPELKWFENNNPEHLAIRLSQNQATDYVLLVSNRNQENTYSADLTLRNSHGILEKDRIHAKSLNLFFNKVESWVARKLQIREKINTGKPGVSEYALETYLRARDKAIHKNYEQSKLLLNALVKEEPDFPQANLLLADVESESGNYSKSQAMIEIWLNKPEFEELKPALLNIQAKNHLFLNLIDIASSELNESIRLAQNNKDYDSWIRALTIKVVIDANTNNINQSTVDTLKKQLDLLERFNPAMNQIALINQNLAGIYQNLGQLEPAINHINKSIDIYTSENNISGIVSANTILARIYNSQGDVGKALLALDKVKDLYSQIDSLQIKRMFLQFRAENLAYFGEYTQAMETINQLMELSLQKNDLSSRVIALIQKTDIHILYKEFDAARTDTDKLLNIAHENPEGFIPAYNELIIAYDIYVSTLLQQPEATRKKIEDYLKKYPDIRKNYKLEFEKFEAALLNQEGFKNEAVNIYHELVNEYLKQNRMIPALYTAYDILDIQWQNNHSDFVRTLNLLEEISVFKYPVLKYRAMESAKNHDLITAYALMVDLKSKANQFWTTEDQLTLESYKSGKEL